MNPAGSIQASRLESGEEHCNPKPPKCHKKPEPVAEVHPGSQAEEDAKGAEAAPLVKDSQSKDFTAYLRLDERGMILPHSILGTLDDFQRYLEARGEKNLLRHFPKSVRDPSSEAKIAGTDTTKSDVSHQRSIQSNALENWDKHMTHRRQKQEQLSYSLNRPVENLLMNQDKHFRETTEQREILNRAMPLAHSGYGYRVGSEFWSLPQRYGDELSGITATLTQTERGRKRPITHVGHPSSIQKEKGIISTGTERPASLAWGQSAYLQSRCRELEDLLQDIEIRKPDISILEVKGVGKPLLSLSEDQSLSLLKEEEDKKINVIEEEKCHRDSEAETTAVEVEALPFPALRINGQLATWTENSTSDKAVGISTSVLLESQTGEIVSTELELRNEGCTVIFYSWKKLPNQLTLTRLYPQMNHVRFYLRSSSGVIRPSETQRVEFIFKSDKQGVCSEVWQLDTHPLLLQGASIRIRLSGVALNEDKTADQRSFIANKLEKAVVENLCRSIAHEVVGRVHSAERPRSPAELYMTEEQLFRRKNPNLQYRYQPVEDLKTLWQQVNPSGCWDFSVDTLRQALLSLPVEEERFSRLNSLCLQLCEPPELKHQLMIPTVIGRQLWINLLDLMGGEAIRLSAEMGPPEKEICADVTTRSPTDGKVQNKRDAPATEKTGVRSKLRDGSRSESRTLTDDVSLEENKIRGKKKDDTGKRLREKQGKSSDSLADASLENATEVDWVDEEVLLTYRRALHTKVYAWMGDLVGNLCDLLDDIHVDDGLNPQCC